MADESFFTGSKHVVELHPKDYVEGNTHPWKLKKAPRTFETEKQRNKRKELNKDRPKERKIHAPRAERSAVMYYASWCGHCIRFKDTWEALYRVNGCMKLCAFNCAKYDAYYRDRLNFSETVRGFPSIVFYKGTDPVETYQGSRDPPDELVKTMLMFCKSN